MDKTAIGMTSRHLSALLLQPNYARRWQEHITRRQSHALHQSAVCQVIADYLWSSGLHPITDEKLPRTLKDRVYRALTGQSLSLGTLRWFIEAFEMTGQDTADLLRLAEPHGAHATLVAGRSVAPGTLPPKHHETLRLDEVHKVGPDGLPESHRTVHTIRAVEDLDRYSCVFDTDAASIRVLRGGHSGQPYALDQGLYAVDIILDEPLLAGQTTTVEFHTTFWYRSAPPAELRRATSGRIAELSLRVQFHQLRLPISVWWSEWPGIDDAPASSERLSLAADKSVTRQITDVEHTVVGFRWELARRPSR